MFVRGQFIRRDANGLGLTQDQSRAGRFNFFAMFGEHRQLWIDQRNHHIDLCLGADSNDLFDVGRLPREREQVVRITDFAGRGGQVRVADMQFDRFSKSLGRCSERA